MDQDKYIHSLENLLIFMCQTYETQESTLRSLARQGNNAFYKVPMIQGGSNIESISQLANMNFQHPELGFREIKDEIAKKRS